MAINRKLGKTTDIRLAMLKTQVTDLLLHGQIETTVARAKEVQPMAEKLIALAIREKDNFEEPRQHRSGLLDLCTGCRRETRTDSDFQQLVTVHG